MVLEELHIPTDKNETLYHIQKIFNKMGHRSKQENKGEYPHDFRQRFLNSLKKIVKKGE